MAAEPLESAEGDADRKEPRRGGPGEAGRGPCPCGAAGRGEAGRGIADGGGGGGDLAEDGGGVWATGGGESTVCGSAGCKDSNQVSAAPVVSNLASHTNEHWNIAFKHRPYTFDISSCVLGASTLADGNEGDPMAGVCGLDGTGVPNAGVPVSAALVEPFAAFFACVFFLSYAQHTVLW